jgi:hypothetical protein
MASARTLPPGSPEPSPHTLATHWPGAKAEEEPGCADALYDAAPECAGAASFDATVRGITARQAIVATDAYIEKRFRIPLTLGDPAVPVFIGSRFSGLVSFSSRVQHK